MGVAEVPEYLAMNPTRAPEEQPPGPGENAKTTAHIVNVFKNKYARPLKKGLIRKLIFFSYFCSGGRFSLKKTWSGLNFGVLGPENSDSSSKTTYMVLFPG